MHPIGVCGLTREFLQLFFRAATLASSGPSSRPWQPNLDGWLDPGVSVNQTISAKQEKNQNVFRSDLRWYFGAAVLQLATVLLILPMYWGWVSKSRSHIVRFEYILTVPRNVSSGRWDVTCPCLPSQSL